MQRRRFTRRRRTLTSLAAEALEDRRLLAGDAVPLASTPHDFPIDALDLQVADDDLTRANDPIGDESFEDDAFRDQLFLNNDAVNTPPQPATSTFDISRLTEEFLVFDDLQMSNKPDLSGEYGFEQAQRFGHWHFFTPGGSFNQADLDRAADMAQRIDPGQLFVVNIEAWPNYGSDETVEETIDKFIEVIDTVRSVNPGLVLGVYRMMPLRDYWTPVLKDYDSPEHAAWLAESERMSRLAEHVDVIFPSLYTLYPDYNEDGSERLFERERWQTYAIKNLQQAQMYGKPIVSYLWPYYHGGGGGSTDPDAPNYRYWKNQPISGEFWKVILETTYEYSDSIIFWGDGRWDEDAEWWSVTQEFMAEVTPTAPSTESTTTGSIASGSLADVSSRGLPRVTIDVTSANDPPTAIDDFFAMSDSSVSFSVLEDNGHGADFDVDGSIDPTSVSVVTQPAVGQLVDHGSGNFTYTVDEDFVGTATFTYTVQDELGATSSPATVTFQSQLPPVAQDDAVTINEDQEAAVFVIWDNGFGIDYDPDGNLDTDSVAIVTGVTEGVLTNLGSGVLSYQPPANFHGVVTFTYTISDTTNLVSEPATVTITINDVNDPPVAHPDSAATSEGVPVTINVLGGDGADTDVDGTLVTSSVEIVSAPNLGTAEVLPDGAIQYTPDPTVFGNDQFTYRVQDDDGAWSQPAEVTVSIASVNEVPVAMDDQLLVPRDIARPLYLFDDNGNGPDTDDTDLSDATITIIQSPVNGQLESLGGDHYRYTPNPSFTGSDSFQYTITDAEGAVSDPATVAITVTSDNFLPIAAADQFTIPEDTSLESFDILADNGHGPDSDIDGELDRSTVSLLSQPAEGTLTHHGDGTFSYTPPLNFVGSVTFPYTVADNDGGVSNQATVTIHVTQVNDPPVAVSDVITTDEDTAVTVDLRADQGNGPDTDPDGELAGSDVETTPPDHGTVVVTVDGNVTYSPDSDFFGMDLFTYRVIDAGGLMSDWVDVDVTVTPVNDPPVAPNQAATTQEETTVTIDVWDENGPLATDVDSPLDQTWSAIAAQPDHGIATILGNGVIEYTPEVDFVGTDEFMYTVRDLEGAVSDPALVTIIVENVNDAPVAVDDFVTTPQETPITIGVLEDLGGGPDFDIDSLLEDVTVAIVDAPDHGSATTNSDQTVTYTPSTSFFGTDSFTYTIQDDQGAVSQPATVTVLVNSPPVAHDDSIVTDEDVTVLIDVLQENDGPADHDPEGSLHPEDVTILSQPQHGTLVQDSSGAWQYTPTANYFGTDQWTYEVNDEGGATSNPATVSVTINSVNDPPVAIDDAAEVTEDQWMEINVLANHGSGADADIDSQLDPASTEILQLPSNGVVNNQGNGFIRYTPEMNFVGDDTFTYRVADEQGIYSNAATVTMTVLPANLAPRTRPDQFSTPEDTGITINVLLDNGSGADADADGSLVPSSIIPVHWPKGSAISNFQDGRFFLRPDADFAGVESFTYYIRDDQGVPGYVYESLAEVDGELSHQWTFDLPDRSAQHLSIRGYHDSQSEAFAVRVSTDGSTWLPTDIMLGNTVSRQIHTFSEPPTGTLHVQIVDTNPQPNEAVWDQVHIDHMYVVTDRPPQIGLPELSISDATIVEADNGERFAEFVVTRTGDTSSTASFLYETIGGSAVADDDFTDFSPRVTVMSVGQTEQAIRVSLAPDDEPELEEQFQLKISHAVSAQIVDASGQATLPAHDLAQIAQTHVFYNDSQFDGFDPTANAGDDDAIATDKSLLLLSEQAASGEHYTNYTKGINGLMFDIANLPSPSSLTADDFEFHTQDADGKWIALETLPTIAVRESAGDNGTARVTLVWPNGSIVNTWLRIRVLSTENTMLAKPEEFYVGSLVGDTHNAVDSAISAAVDFADLQQIFGHLFQPANIESSHDTNRDGVVDFDDAQIVHDNLFQQLEMISTAVAAHPTTAILQEDQGNAPHDHEAIDLEMAKFERDQLSLPDPYKP